MVVFDKKSVIVDPKLCALFADVNPWWIWSVSGDSVYMANPIATREMGAVGKAITSLRIYSPKHPFAAQIIEAIKTYSGGEQTITLNLRSGASSFTLSKIFLNNEEAFLIRSPVTLSRNDALLDFAESISDPVLIFDLEGKPQKVNDAAESLAGYALPNLLGFEGKAALSTLDTTGSSQFSLSTGTLVLHRFDDLGVIFGCVVGETLPVEQPLTPVIEQPLVAPLVILRHEDAEVSIEGTMPAKLEVKTNRKKANRFVWASDEKGVFSSVSPELSEIVGGDYADISGQSWHDILKTYAEDPENQLLKALDAKETKTGHTVLWKVQGEKTKAKIDIAALPVFDKVRGFIGYRGFGLLREYTAEVKPRAKKEPTSKLSTEEIKNFNSVATVLKAVMPKKKLAGDAEVIYFGNQILYVNDQFLQLTGFVTREEFDAAGGTARLFAGRHIAQEVDGFTLTHKNNEELPVSVRLLKTDWQGQSALKMIISAGVKPLKPTHMGDDFITYLAFPTAIIDEKGKIEQTNTDFNALFGDDMKGKAFQTLVAPESHVQGEDYITSLLSNGVRSVINEGRELLFKTTHSQVKPLFLKLSLINNNVAGKIIAQFVDNSGSKAHEKDLQKAKMDVERVSLAKTHFLNEVSHEIRTPLNAIIGFSETMLEERLGALPATYRGYARDIQSAGQHILSLVNDLLDLAKIESGKTELNFQKTDLEGAIEEAVALMQDQALKAQVVIRKSYAAAMPIVLADHRSLKQILLNILANALRFTPKSGQIIISLMMNESDEAVIRVRDTGVGMSADTLAKAMEPWQSSGKGGTGLGLPIIKALSEANRARFTLTSSEGQGTLAEVAFPQERIL